MHHHLLGVTFVEVVGYIGIAAGVIIALALTYVAYHIWKFKRAISQLGKSFKELGETFQQGIIPKDLGLERADDTLLADNADATAQMHRFQTAGMRFGGCYTSKHMAGAKIATFADPARSVSAALAAVPPHGVTLDVVTMYEDGSAITHRTLKSLGLDHPPEFRNVFVPEASADELLRRHLAERDDKPARTFQPHEVADAMEEFNQAVLRWRNARDGLNEDEVRRNLQVMGTDADDMSVKMLVAMSQAEATNRVRDELKTALLPLVGWNEERWKRDGSRVVFVQDGMTETQAVNHLYTPDMSPDDEDVEAFREALTSVGARRAMADFVRENPEMGITFLATATQPVQFDAYLHPADDESENSDDDNYDDE